ncbi:hypothetical protein J3R30DRAFT_3510265, partial [Lentinula aciculospora]
MTVILPNELYELIIDELRYSFPDLKACSLVCKAWLSRCRHHLYRVIRIGPRRIHGIEKERMPFFLNKYQASFTHTFTLPEITFCIQGLSIESRMRDILYTPPLLTVPPTLHQIPKGRAVLKPSIFSVELPFQPLRFLRTHWKMIDLLNDQKDGMNDIEMFERVLDRIQSLEHLVIEKYWNFHSRRDILRSIAVHAPKLKILCLSEFRWYPSFNHLVLEDIFDEWMVTFMSMNVPPLRLDRLCLRYFSPEGTNLIQTVVLPSPCLDLRALRFLAMPAKDLHAALAAGRFPDLGKELVHLTLTYLNITRFRLRSESFPKLEELQLFVNDKLSLFCFFQDLASHWIPTSTSLNLHINFEIPISVSESDSQEVDLLHEAVDSALYTFIRKWSWKSVRTDESTKSPFTFYISLDFMQADGLEMQRECMKKAFPQCFATGCLHWRDRRSLEWWF